MHSGRSLNLWETGAALVVIALGAFLLWHGTSYPLGELSRMGPGFFPVGLGVILLALGAAVLFEVRHSDTPPPDLRLRPFLAITAGLLAFALMLVPFGLIPATVALVLLSALAETPVRPVAVVSTAAVVAAIGYFVFLRGFGLQLEAIAW